MIGQNIIDGDGSLDDVYFKSGTKAGFDPSQDRDESGRWTSLGDVQGSMEREFPDLTIDIYQYDKRKQLILSRVVVPEEQRNMGLGSKFMQSLIEKADQLKYKIALTPSSDFGGTKSRLIEFYERFGFVKNSGSNRDFSHREDMYREPGAMTKAGFDPNQQRGNDGQWTSGPVGEFDRSALEFYTYDDDEREAMNECLRNECDDEHYNQIAKSINDSLTHLPNYEEVTFRGMWLMDEDVDQFLNDLRDDNEILFKGFTSSSPDTDVAVGFTGGSSSGTKPIILTLFGKSGKDIEKYSAFGSDEKEVLFGTNTRWKVKNIYLDGIPMNNGSKAHNIELEEI